MQVKKLSQKKIDFISSPMPSPQQDMILPPPFSSPVFASSHPATVFTSKLVMISFTSSKPLGWMAQARQQYDTRHNRDRYQVWSSSNPRNLWPQYRISLYDHVSMSATCHPLAKPDDDDDIIVTVITNL